jgi:hypothetical protein
MSGEKLKHLAKFVRRQSGAFGNRTHGNRVNGIVAGNDEPLFAVGHHDVSALPGDVIAEFFKNADGIALVYSRKFRHNLNGDEFARETRTFGFGIALCVFFGDFKPELDGFADVGQRFVMRRALAVTAGQRGTGNGKTFLGFNHDNIVLHGGKILWLER